MKLKKLITLGLTLSLLSGLVGCSSDTSKEKKDSSDKKETTEQTTTNEAFREAEKQLLDSLAPLPKPSKEYKLAALEISLSNPFWATVQKGYEDAAKEYNVTCDVLAQPKEDDVNGQLETLKTLLGKDYDAISISSITPFNLIPGVIEANKKNVPVVAVGTSIDEEKGKEANAKISAFITSNFEDQGKLGAEFIMKKAKNGDVAIIEGLSGASQSEARKNGAKKAFESNKDFNIVSVQAGDWDRKKAYDLATNLIQSNPDLKGIFCANDMMALGVIDALKVANKKDQVTVVGVDFIVEAKQSIEKNELDGTVAMSPYLFGKGGLILALKVLEDQEIKQDIYWSPVALVNKENVKTFDGWR